MTDDTKSMETITSTFVAEDLVEQTALEASQNMNIDPSDHANALPKGIGKQYFTIGMNPEYFSISLSIMC
ncbi:hypothetical protein BRADI_3g47605v3 [Brachypodium distachyon]|uniref:Uncharacterized protein n=1 Tax=Brachypodium distachyon TaxID=15368 RepID=A0A0Q3IHQ6_BRADI|nr:hypothetical protein BRADI_3g47605v3 [Brachypodium distachyon]KQK00149.1 hypothetical protein BRADI_3g47605v3 [Brachypodium distachyon]KQK00150.1 hypothetical protein BRADI_3g47605v3 [Brachypodium distachyon]KQK00151.1 hypothetical protein BRADI_3g47605v3 [Brachypodium distachyon]